MAELIAADVDLILIRFTKWTVNSKAIANSLKNGPKGRRIVLVDFPAFGASPKNALLWRTDWDVNQDGKPDANAPTWLRARNKDGNYPLASDNIALRNRLLGPNGLVALLAKSGFDGIVISTVEDPQKRPGADARLASDIMFEGRGRRQGFISFMRNPGAMMDFPVVRGYFDGFVADGLFFGKEEAGVPSPPTFIEETVKRLVPAAKGRRVVLSIAYTSSTAQIAENRKMAQERLFIPLALPNRL